MPRSKRASPREICHQASLPLFRSIDPHIKRQRQRGFATTLCCCSIPSGRILSWNQGSRTDHRLRGRRDHWQELIAVFHPPEDVAVGKPERKLAICGPVRTFRGHRRTRPQGRLYGSSANVVITAIPGPDGKPCGYGKITRDISERVAAETRV